MNENPNISSLTPPLPYYFGTAENEPRDLEGNALSETEEFRDDILPYWNPEPNISKLNPKALSAWMDNAQVNKALGIDQQYQQRLLNRIFNSISKWAQLHHPYSSWGKLCLKDPANDENHYRPILFSKLSKEGKMLKIGINYSYILGQGSYHTAAIFPVLRLQKNEKQQVTVNIKSKILLCFKEDQMPYLDQDIHDFEKGLALQKKGLDATEGSPTLAPLPRRLASIPGVYIQRYFPHDLRSARKRLNQKEQLIALERVARGVSLLENLKISHFDVRPPNILMSQDNTSYLNDFDAAGTFGEPAHTTTAVFPYRGKLFHKSKEIGKKLSYTQGCDLVGLVRTIAETFFPKIYFDTPHEPWLKKGSKERKELLHKLNRIQKRVFFRVVLPILKADQRFKANHTKPNELQRQASRYFSHKDAKWVANELQSIRNEFFHSPDEAPQDTNESLKAAFKNDFKILSQSWWDLTHRR